MIFDAFALLTTKATFIGLRLFVLYLLAATLDSTSFAPIAFGLTITEIVRFVADWGIDTLSLRRFSTPEASEASLRFRSVVKIKAGAAVTAFVVSMPLLVLGAGVTMPLVAALLSFTIVTSLWLNLAVNWLQARGRLRRAATYMALIGILALAVQLAAHLAGLGAAARFAALIVFETAMTMLMLWLAYRELSDGTQPIRLDNARSWLRDATPIALAAILALAYGRFDQIYIKTFYNLNILGNYTLAFRLVEPVQFLMVSVTATVYTRVSGAVQNSESIADINLMAKRWLTFVLSTSIAFSIFAAALGWHYLPIYFRSYWLSPYFLMIILTTLPFRCINLCLTSFIQAFAMFKTTLIISIINAVNISILVIVFGHFYGYFGAAIAVLIGEMTNTALQYFTLRKTLRYEYELQKPVRIS